MPKIPVVPPIWIILGPVLLLVALGVLLSLFVRTGRRPPDDAWRGVFYSNPDDPSLFVPKRFGIGYTLNFGNPWSWAVVVFIILMVALPFVLAGTTIRLLPK
jgi:uncharacterized membrane protein